MIVNKIKLSDIEADEIKTLNAKMVSLKNLIKDLAADSSDHLFSRFITELSKTQILYDDWFIKIQEKNNIKTDASNSWNVDFNLKELQLLKN